MQKIKDFLGKKALGFWFSAAAAVLSVVLFVVYLIGYAGSEYMSWGVPVLIIVSVLAFAGLTYFDKTAAYAPVALLVPAFGGFCVYICSIQIYVAAAFPDGIKPEAFSALSPVFYLTFIFFLLITIAGHIGVYMKQNKKTEKKEAENENE